MSGSVAERYLLLGLRLGRHVDGIVDAYCGPPELAEAVASAEPVEPEAQQEVPLGDGSGHGTSLRVAPRRPKAVRPAQPRGGGANPTKITRPSPPGLTVMSTSRSGFQLLTVQRFPARSITDAVCRIIGMKLGGAFGP